jgi:hypothetical protein
MNVIDLFAQKFNYLLDIRRADGLDMGEPLTRLPGAEKYHGVQYYLRGYSLNAVSGFQWFSPMKPSNLQMPGHLLWIASYPNINLEYVLDTTTGEITTFDLEHYSIEWPCAVDYQAFFQSMLIILDVKTEMAQKKIFEVDQSVLMARYEACMKINGHDQKFSTFYEHILGLELSS